MDAPETNAFLFTGRWEHAGGFCDYLTSVAGLIAGGVFAAPLSG
jgi:uncharacterized protein